MKKPLSGTQPATPWRPGTIILLQEVWHGQLWSARPVRVVRGDADRLALWCPAGTPVKGPTAPWRSLDRSAGAAYFLEMLTFRDWIFGDYLWPVSSLMLLHPGDWYAVWVSWSGDGKDLGWYVNFQRPYTRTRNAVRSMDMMLDLIVDHEMSYRWKDEDEFDALVDAGMIEAAEAGSVRDAAGAVIAKIAANERPFGEPWHEWRPDESWGIPKMPDDWDELCDVGKPSRESR